MERSQVAKHAALSPDREERARTDLFSDLTPDQLADAKESLLETMQTPGWTVIRDALNREAQSVMRQLVDRTRPLEDRAEYEGKLGEVRGLERIESVTDGLIILGEEAEKGD